MSTSAGTTNEYLVNFEFVLEDGADQAAVRALLKERLAKLDGVEQAKVDGATRFDHATVVAAISVGVLLIDKSASAVEAMRKLVRAVRELADEIKGVKGARVQVAGSVVKVDGIADKDLERAAAAARV